MTIVAIPKASDNEFGHACGDAGYLSEIKREFDLDAIERINPLYRMLKVKEPDWSEGILVRVGSLWREPLYGVREFFCPEYRWKKGDKVFSCAVPIYMDQKAAPNDPKMGMVVMMWDLRRIVQESLQ